MQTFYIKQNDTSPDMLVVMKDGSGTVIDLSNAVVCFNMKDQYGILVVDNQPAVIVDPTAGIVKYIWAAGDTAQSGNNYAEFEITFENGSVQTVPNDTDILVKIAVEVG